MLHPAVGFLRYTQVPFVERRSSKGERKMMNPDNPAPEGQDGPLYGILNVTPDSSDGANIIRWKVPAGAGKMIVRAISDIRRNVNSVQAAILWILRQSIGVWYQSAEARETDIHFVDF